MISSRDQLGREIRLTEFPKKIISLVPSISELLWDLNLQEEIIGITKFCIHPDEMFRQKTRIGGTKNLNIALIKELQPELIIGNKEENTQEDIEELGKYFPIWMSDVNTFEDSLSMIHELGILTNRKLESESLIKLIGKSRSKESRKIKVIYLIWQNPIFAAGSHTFIDAMLQEAGFENLIQKNRYPEITEEEIARLKPDFLFLSSEPFPFNEEHRNHFSRFLATEKIKLVDGEMFSWYGSRLLQAFPYFEKLRSELNHGR